MDDIFENSRKSKRVKRSSENFWTSQQIWKVVFFSVLAFYCLYYAPFGINETDGGFLTGLAWQVLSGKTLYQDIIYVRPPLPVLLRAGELLLLPDTWAVLGERWFFYLKIGLYSWLGAAILTSDARCWRLAAFGFIVSVHCYPPMAWHTVDGILFSVLGLWLLLKISSRWGTASAAIAIFAAMLCKQSFYPMAAVFLGLLILPSNFPKVKNFRKVSIGVGMLLLCSALFFSYLYSKNLLDGYLQMTGNSTSGNQALQHGVFDYFRVNPVLVFMLLPVVWHFRTNKPSEAAYEFWNLWLSILIGHYAFSVWNFEKFTPPFSAARSLFWVGLLFAVFLKIEDNTLKIKIPNLKSPIPNPPLLALLAVSWCASVSWGYNLPILFSTPWVFAAMEISRHLWRQAYPNHGNHWRNFMALLGLLVVFRFGYEYVYRDGRRSEMTEPMGEIFPRLSGIYSSAETADLYRDLRNLAERYPNFKTLPTFTQANFLTKTHPRLPLDWVVNRETNGDNALIFKNLKENQPVFFFRKQYPGKSDTERDMSITDELLRNGRVIEETSHFWVMRQN